MGVLFVALYYHRDMAHANDFVFVRSVCRCFRLVALCSQIDDLALKRPPRLVKSHGSHKNGEKSIKILSDLRGVTVAKAAKKMVIVTSALWPQKNPHFGHCPQASNRVSWSKK